MVTHAVDDARAPSGKTWNFCTIAKNFLCIAVIAVRMSDRELCVLTLMSSARSAGVCVSVASSSATLLISDVRRNTCKPVPVSE